MEVYADAGTDYTGIRQLRNKNEATLSAWILKSLRPASIKMSWTPYTGLQTELGDGRVFTHLLAQQK